MQKIVARRRKSFLYFCIDINILDNQMLSEIVMILIVTKDSNNGNCLTNYLIPDG